MLSNYHSHSNYCDGSSNIEEYILQALNMGFTIYGFSSHAPLPFSCKWSMPASQIKDYLRRIDYIKNRWEGDISILKSLEIDYIPGVMGPKHPTIEKLNLDYTIGSIHFLNTFKDGTHWCIDDNHRKFIFGLNTIYHGNVKKVVEDYYATMRKMVIEETPTIIGHLDKIKMHNQYQNHFNEDEEWYVNEIHDTLDTIKKSGAFVEINTRGFYKLKIKELYPSTWIIKEMIQKQIPLVLNSDAHTPYEINKGFEYALKLLKSLGSTSLKNYINDEWIDTPIREVETSQNRPFLKQ